ncbi:MAG: hypothetical protein IT580_01280 [Verrucomicrobiales bacterium]|nr:hypothetical protein [Verrucomicrobiales bacterium]
MRLTRSIKMLRGPIDASALAGTLFLLWTATLMHSSLVLPPGLRLQLPEAKGLWGEVIPEMSLAVDARHRILFEHQLVAETNLAPLLRARARQYGTNASLLLMADRGVTTEVLLRLGNLAREAGVAEVVIASSPTLATEVGEGP